MLYAPIDDGLLNTHHHGDFTHRHLPRLIKTAQFLNPPLIKFVGMPTFPFSNFACTKQ